MGCHQFVVVLCCVFAYGAREGLLLCMGSMPGICLLCKNPRRACFSLLLSHLPNTTRVNTHHTQQHHRVVKPGGLVVLTDSVQLGDRPVWDKTLGNFGNMNEPHYR